MADGVQFELKGLEELNKKLNQLLEAETNKAKALSAGAWQLRNIAVENAPVDTHNLQNSAYVDEKNDGVEVGFAADYAIYQEVGTSKMPGKHYMQRSIDEGEEQIMEAIKNQLKKMLGIGG